MKKQRADLKSELAEYGQTLLPDATLEHVEKPTGPVSIIILDRVVKDAKPDYCLHGYASCIRCDHLCWLGHNTSQVVTSRQAYGLCLDCANELHAAGELPGEADSRVEDHKRADGPHE